MGIINTYMVVETMDVEDFTGGRISSEERVDVTVTGTSINIQGNKKAKAVKETQDTWSRKVIIAVRTAKIYMPWCLLDACHC